MPTQKRARKSDEARPARPTAKRKAASEPARAPRAPVPGSGLAASHDQLLQLHKQVGNRAVARMVSEPAAEQPLDPPVSTVQRSRADAPAVGLEGGEAGDQIEARLAANKGGGRPLPERTRAQMERGIGADFSSVRVHTGSESQMLNRQLGAQAFTHGSDIFMAEGKFAPGSSDGQRLLAHELTHVVQQGASPVRRQPELAEPGLEPNVGEALEPELAQRALVQRDQLAAGQVDRPSWVLSRPTSVKAIDTALAQLANKLATLPGAIDQIKTLITSVLTAITQYDSSKDKGGKWDTNVASLKVQVQQKELEIDAKIADQAQGRLNYEAFKTMEPGLAQYATRSQFSASDFNPTTLAAIGGPSVRAALTRPRSPDGQLTQAAIDEMNTVQAAEAASEKDPTGKDVTLAGMSIDEIRAFMAAHTNSLTHMTEYPELRNITDPSPSPDNVVTTPVTISGVAMQVEHNASDVNYVDRLKLVQDAVAKIAASGLTVPALSIHLPKYGRGLKMRAGVGVTGEPSCEIGSKSSRAVFVPPGFMHLSSEVIGTPDVTEVTNPATRAKEYKFSSTGFDPSGTATIVHEFGHAMHYAASPGKFHGLWGTSFKAPGAQLANAEVSQYGNKPREFVAEVFLGLMYGKNYSDEVLRMYKAFGGVVPPALAARVGAL